MSAKPQLFAHGDSPAEGRVLAAAVSAGSETHLVPILGLRALLRVSGTREQRIAAIAGLQRGRVNRRQLLAAGLTPDAVEGRLRRGLLYRVHAGVYCVAHTAPVELGRETAALLACRDGAVLSHHTAAALWRIRPPQAAQAPIHLTVAGGNACRRIGIVVHRTRKLPPRDIRIEQRLPVTSPARTMLDMAECLTQHELEWALDEAFILRLMRPDDLEDAIDRLASRPGAAQLKRLMRARQRSGATGATRAGSERQFQALIRAARLPEPERNANIYGFSVDFLWREHNVAVEIDSYTFHMTKSAFERDRRKETVFRANRLDLARFTKVQMDQEPLAVIADVARMLGKHSDAHPNSGTSRVIT
jgi:very-short-patch-repair endonuclease